MRLSEAAHKELRLIVEQEFGEDAKELTDEDIHGLGWRLLLLTRVVVQRHLDGADAHQGEVDCIHE
jgi:hypothetical protein